MSRLSLDPDVPASSLCKLHVNLSLWNVLLLSLFFNACCDFPCWSVCLPPYSTLTGHCFSPDSTWALSANQASLTLRLSFLPCWWIGCLLAVFLEYSTYTLNKYFSCPPYLTAYWTVTCLEVRTRLFIAKSQTDSAWPVRTPGKWQNKWETWLVW